MTERKNDSNVCAFSACGAEYMHDSALRERVRTEIVRLVTEKGVGRFLCGMERGADMLCAEIVLELKADYPQLELYCVFPFEEQAADWNEADRDRYFSIAERCDREIMLQTRYTPGCRLRCEWYITGSADYVLTVGSEMQCTVKYA